jgi:hypothetical protein
LKKEAKINNKEIVKAFNERFVLLKDPSDDKLNVWASSSISPVRKHK